MDLAARLGLRWTDGVNLVAALALGTAAMAEIWVPLESRHGTGSPALTAVVVWLVCLLTVVRRRARIPTLLGAGAVNVLGLLVGPVYITYYGQFVPSEIMLFTCVRYGPRRAPLVAGLGTLAFLLTVMAAESWLQDPNEVVYQLGFSGAVWLAAFGLRVQASRVELSRRRAIQIEVAAAEATMAAVDEERTRIARELHDIVAHSLSVIVVQAGAAEQVVDEDPAYVRGALERIRGTGTDALSEMRRVVSLIRDPGLAGALAPQPGLGDVADLAEQARSAELAVDYRVTGDPLPLGAGLELTAYRIVQEALTNVRKHAGASRVTVEIDYASTTLGVRVTDDGRGAAAASGPTSGHGLIGMRERAAAYGGSVEVSHDDGFTVRVRLPLDLGAPSGDGRVAVA